ncbi:MAG: hypothetical protein ACK5N8_02235 [Alphaproteobacteria bacterium]
MVRTLVEQGADPKELLVASSKLNEGMLAVSNAVIKMQTKKGKEDE